MSDSSTLCQNFQVCFLIKQKNGDVFEDRVVVLDWVAVGVDSAAKLIVAFKRIFQWFCVRIDAVVDY
jgi:hypothetical protein